MAGKRVDDRSRLSKEMVEDAETIFSGYLKKIGLKQTAQRNTILRIFLETREHLSVDGLYQLVKKRDRKIGFTTVYRTLKLFSESGLASVVDFHDGTARYEHQYNRRSHHHMICIKCGESVEFSLPEIEELEKKIGRRYKYKTTAHTFQIQGLCPKCKDK